MFATFKRSDPPPSVRRTDRTLLRLEALDDRVLPSTVIYTETFDWNGVASVVVTVTEDAPGYTGLYLWNYELTNDSYTEGIRTFALPVEDSSMVSQAQMGNDIGWLNGFGLMGDPDLVTWAGPQNPGGGGGEALDGSLGLYETANFWFTTAPTGVALTNGVITDGTLPSLSVMPAGFVATALDELVEDPLRPILVGEAADKNNPFFGLTSLREAVKDANDNTPAGQQQQIQFKDGLANATITLRPDAGYQQLRLEKNIFVNGEDKNITIRRDASSPTKYRIFEVLANVDAKLTGLTLRDGELDGGVHGGAVLSNGNLTLENCVFAQNKAIDGRGGAVDAASGSLTVSGCSFTGNSAQLGGGLYIGQRVTTTISSSSFVLNTATQSGATPVAYGGGIYIASSSTGAATNVTLDAVDVNGNSAISKGGGIYVSTDGPSGTVLTLSGGTDIHNNVVTGASGKGGGLYFGRGLLVLSGMSITNNSAPTGPQAYRVVPNTSVGEVPGTNNTYTEVTGGP